MNRHCINAFLRRGFLLPLALVLGGFIMIAALPQSAGAQAKLPGDSVKAYKPCPKCGVANFPQARFCYSCGAAIEAGAVPAVLPDSARGDLSQAVRCPVCGTVRNPPDANFCSYCGLSFAETPNPGAPLKIEAGPKRNPVRAFCYSLLLPGTGQFYNGQPVKGRIFLGSYLVGWGLFIYGFGQAIEHMDSGPENAGEAPALTGLVLLGGSWIFSMIDAQASARDINRRRGYSSLTRPGVGLVFVPDPLKPRGLQPGVGLQTGF